MSGSSHGYAGRILRIDLDRRVWRAEPLDHGAARRFIGGRGFNVATLYAEVAPHTPGLDPQNRLCFGVGPLVGTLFSGASRFNVSAMSPQTGILGDSNAGGFFGPELKFAGWDQVILEGRADSLIYLLVTEDGVQFRPADHLRGLDVWATDEAVRHELDDDRAQVAVAGPAAEKGVKFAGIFTNLVRAAARTGMGTVMAAKNVKAMAVRGRRPVTVADPTRFMDLVRTLNQEIKDHDQYQPRIALGTTRLLGSLNEMGALCVRHYQVGRFEAASEVSGETLAGRYRVKGKSCFACNIPCSRFFRVGDGSFAGLASEGPEFEGLAGFTSKLGQTDLALGLAAIDKCNRYGLDVIGTAEVIAWAMELRQRGLMSDREADGLELTWGNGPTILALIDKIAVREGFGDVLADGVLAAARKVGRGSESLAMQVKGLEFFQADPRGLKGYALGLAVASRGGDHLRSEPSFEFSEDAPAGQRRFGAAESAFRLEHKGKGRLVKHFEELCALADCLEACKNTIVNMEVLPFDRAAEILRAATGLDFDGNQVQQACERLINLERLYNAREGLSRADDRLPERFLKEPLPAGSGPSTGSVVELEPMLDEYYSARGWDLATGLPAPEKLAELGLGEEARQVELKRTGRGRIGR
ncbi:MAG TPA: aldehyde ferredoxin oxidoreductase family protein [Bacillota bacterium]|jgi:aldehyde:ferredoxin oxidoreductase